MTPKLKKVIHVSADLTSTFDGSSVDNSSLQDTVASAIANDPQWAGAVGLNVEVRDCE